MSIRLMTRLYDKDLGSTDQRVMLALCDSANDFGTECYPSFDYIAWKLGADRKTVMRAVARMEARGVLTVTREHRRNNRYTINLEVLPDKPPFEGRKGTQDLGSQKGTQAPKGPKEGVKGTQGGTERDPIGSQIKGPHPSVNHESYPSVEPSVGAERAKRRPSRIPATFAITDEMRAWASAKLDATPQQLATATEGFIDYWLGEGKTKVDWPATWRGWMRREFPAAPDAGPAEDPDVTPGTEIDWVGKWGTGARSVTRAEMGANQ